jgi:DNA-binding transcriptional regulator YiaG
MTSSTVPTEHLPLVALIKAARLPPPDERRAIREAAGVSISALARELGVSPSAVSVWEKGTFTPRPRRAAAYGDLLRALQELTCEQRDSQPQK